MNHKTVLSKYPNSTCKKIENKFFVTTGLRQIGEGYSRELAWEDAARTIRQESLNAEGVKESFIDAIYNDASHVKKVLTIEEILDTIDEAKEVVRKSLSKNKLVKAD